MGDLLFLAVLEVLGLYPVGLVESQYQLPYWDSIEPVLLRLRMSLNIVGLMGLNIRGLIETGKRENGGGKMGFALFSAGPGLIRAGPV